MAGQVVMEQMKNEGETSVPKSVGEEICAPEGIEGLPRCQWLGFQSGAYDS